jgi:hypothetical protein
MFYKTQHTGILNSQKVNTISSVETQRTAKKYFTPKRKSLELWQALKGEPLVGII